MPTIQTNGTHRRPIGGIFIELPKMQTTILKQATVAKYKETSYHVKYQNNVSIRQEDCERSIADCNNGSSLMFALAEPATKTKSRIAMWLLAKSRKCLHQ